MRKIYVSAITLIFFSFMMLAVVSCKKEGFLTATTTTNLTQQTVFSDSANAEGFLANIYASVGFATSPSRFVYNPGGANVVCGGLDAACDESETSHQFSTAALAFATGSVNAISVKPGTGYDDPYNTCYTQIRAVNQLFANISKVPLKPANKTSMLAEARFLRAWYYFILLEHYGGVPLIGDKLFSYTAPISAKRNTFEETVNYIVSQCDSAGASLPIIQSGLNYGRASKGACLALKARVLLYAASPLFNNPTPGGFGPNGNKTPQDIAKTIPVVDVNGHTIMIDQKPLVGYASYDKTRWQLAENAAAAVIGLNAYSLFTDSTNINGYGEVGAFQNLFTQRVNNEYIFQLMQPNNNTYLEGLFQPPSRTGANGAFPYQGMVDAFPMKNGLPITDPNSGYDATNPYANRDPRLKYSIIYDQALMGNRTPNGQIAGYSPVNIYLNNGLTGGTDAVYQGTPTGYYNNKMLDPNAISEGFFNTSQRCLPLIRYAEILLDYAEAANEFEGPTQNVYDAVNAVRQRAGLSPYQLPTGLTLDQMRTYIQNERRVELAYEGHRFFDVRRWVIADQAENIIGKGMEVDRTNGVPTYKIFDVRSHVFSTKMYLWPFPQTEIGKGAGLAQNPGY